MKQRVMVFCDYYFPSVKSGGGMWTILNLVDRFHHDYDFFVVARNYDSRGDRRPYTTVKTDRWNETGNAQVFYFSPQNLSGKFFAHLVDDIHPDLILLNSVFSTPVLKMLSARRRKLIGDIPVMLAATGELSAAALAVSRIKKKLFLSYARLTGLYRGVVWKASFDAERDEIKQAIGEDAEVIVAPDLSPITILPNFEVEHKPRKEPGRVSFIFLSRMVRKKNLRYLIERLGEVCTGNIELKVVGPREDKAYWKECQAAIDALPTHVKVEVLDAVTNAEALKMLVDSHFFVSATSSENFGYVFLESLAAGCPLVISDRTAWEDVDARGAGWRIPLEDPSAWVDKFNSCIAMDDATYRDMSSSARAYALDWLKGEDVVRANAAALRTALARGVTRSTE
jgi:glycosyltransferase involved in cell wall biosynthesis